MCVGGCFACGSQKRSLAPLELELPVIPGIQSGSSEEQPVLVTQSPLQLPVGLWSAHHKEHNHFPGLFLVSLVFLN